MAFPRRGQNAPFTRTRRANSILTVTSHVGLYAGPRDQGGMSSGRRRAAPAERTPRSLEIKGSEKPELPVLSPDHFGAAGGVVVVVVVAGSFVMSSPANTKYAPIATIAATAMMIRFLRSMSRASCTSGAGALTRECVDSVRNSWRS